MSGWLRDVLWLIFLVVTVAWPPGAAAMSMDSHHTFRQQLANFPAYCGEGYPQPGLKDRDLLQKFYTISGFVAVWSPVAIDQLLAQIGLLEDDGLDLQFYPSQPLLTAAQDNSGEVCREFLASFLYLSALADLRFGWLSPQGSESIWRADDPAGDEAGGQEDSAPRDALVTQAGAKLNDVPAAFAWARPSHPLYRQLREAYHQLRMNPWREWQAIADGPLLRPGASDTRVEAIAKRLKAQDYLAVDWQPDGYQYDGILEAAVRAFQHDHGEKADGIVGPSTLAAMNIPLSTRRDQLRINLERLRWLLHKPTSSRLVVDIAGARALYYVADDLAWQGRTQVGRPSRPTPVLASHITHLTFHPRWTVPPTIFFKDKLPLIRADLGYLAKNKLRVFDLNGVELDPAQVDWRHPRGVILRQDAGPKGALGQVAIRFPNPFSVYLHDTPEQALFLENNRYFSSGCVRVERAMELADLLLPETAYPQLAAIKAGSATRNVSLATPVDLIAGYWTADGDAQGRVHFKPDVYQRDDALIRRWYRLRSQRVSALVLP